MTTAASKTAPSSASLAHTAGPRQAFTTPAFLPRPDNPSLLADPGDLRPTVPTAPVAGDVRMAGCTPCLQPEPRLRTNSATFPARKLISVVRLGGRRPADCRLPAHARH